MSTKRISRNIDILAAMIVLVLGIAISGVAYAKIVKLEQGENLPFGAIAEGESRYLAFSNGQCVGTFKTTLNHDKSYYLSSSGELKAAYANSDIIAKVDFQAYFNPLAQLFESSTKFDSQIGKLELETDGINPIQLEFTAALGEKNYNYKINIPGPILLRRVSKTEYNIQTNSSGSTLNLIRKQPLLDGLRVNLKKESSPNQECSAAHKLDLTQTVDAFRGLIPSWLNKLQTSGSPK